jgi:mannose-6-phosphate isomerase-like protein (cupin superfamily)
LHVEAAPIVSDRPGRIVRALCEDPRLDVTWSRYEGGQPGPDPHVHHEHVDAFYIVEGELRFLVGPDVEPVRAPAGTFVLVPPNVVHGFDNVSDSTTRWLNFHAPSTGFIPYLRGERDGFDSFDPPADGGRAAEDATIAHPDARGALGRESQFAATEVELAPGADHEPGAEGVECAFVLAGSVEPGGGPGAWLRGPGTLRNPGPGPARLLHVGAPAA